MALSVIPLVDNVRTFGTYQYMYEPLFCRFSGTTVNDTKLFIDLTVDYTTTGGLIETYEKYVEYDLVFQTPIDIDLMKIVRELHDHNIYKINNINDIGAPNNKVWSTIQSEPIYTIRAYTNITQNLRIAITELRCIIIGSRNYFEMNRYLEENSEGVLSTSPNAPKLNEFEVNGIDMSNRFPSYPRVNVTLPTSPRGDRLSTVTIETPVPTVDNPEECVEQFVIWKSRYGGWMHWGFESSIRTENSNYTGSLGDIEIMSTNFNSTSSGDKYYIPTNYSGIESSYKIALKSYGLKKDMLKALAGIKHSPAIYIMKDKDGLLELMKLTSVTAPQDSKNNGGDFSIILSSVIKQNQLTR